MAKEEMYVDDCEKAAFEYWENNPEKVKESIAYKFAKSAKIKNEACENIAKILNVPMYIINVKRP